MTPQQVVGVGVRLFAVWLGLTSLGYFLAAPAALAANPFGSGDAVMLSYAMGAGCVAAGLLLWFAPMLVAHKLLPRTQHDNRLSLQAHELARVGCSLLGLWLLARALPSLMWFLLRSFVMVDAGSSFSALGPDARLDVAVSLFEAVFALLLMLKSAAFARLVTPAQTPSTREPDAD